MKLVDAHIHLSDDDYSGCVDEIVQEAKALSVVTLVSNSMDLKTSIGSLELAERFPSMVYAAVGIHPWTVNDLTDDQFQETIDFISKKAKSKGLVAIGEIGLDFKYMNIWDRQLKVFDSMLHLAEKLVLPVIIHSRGTTAQIVDMLPSYSVKKVLLHWFSNPISALTKAVDHGFYISEGAPVVFSNGIRDVVKKVPMENLLTETDGPVRFFRPPFQGKRTTSAFIPTIVKAIAEVRKMDPESVAEHVRENFEGFFGIKVN
ncbi:TatD family hydrolase [Candidatus Bathyarchaeota archaeon]|jgi:TatD DNase family protein|nr:TatD family hydrolase [Candidatus Bathyarchaeota archaeon]